MSQHPGQDSTKVICCASPCAAGSYQRMLPVSRQFMVQDGLLVSHATLSRKHNRQRYWSHADRSMIFFKAESTGA